MYKSIRNYRMARCMGFTGRSSIAHKNTRMDAVVHFSQSFFMLLYHTILGIFHQIYQASFSTPTCLLYRPFLPGYFRLSTHAFLASLFSSNNHTNNSSFCKRYEDYSFWAKTTIDRLRIISSSYRKLMDYHVLAITSTQET